MAKVYKRICRYYRFTMTQFLTQGCDWVEVKNPYRPPPPNTPEKVSPRIYMIHESRPCGVQNSAYAEKSVQITAVCIPGMDSAYLEMYSGYVEMDSGYLGMDSWYFEMYSWYLRWTLGT